MPTTRLCKKELPVKLTLEERLAAGNELCEALAEYDKVEAEKKIATRGFNEKLGGINARIGTLSRKYHDGEELRDVECEQIKDIVAKTVRVIRLDTFEQVGETRNLSDWELQTELPGIPEASSDPDADQEPAAGDEPPTPPALLKAPIGDRASKRKRKEKAERDEVQAVAESPEEAEALRADRLADEAASRASAATVEACTDEFHGGDSGDDACRSCGAAF